MSETPEQTAETMREQIITLAKAIQQREADKKKSDGPTESDREIEHALRKSESPRGQQATIDRLTAQVAKQQREIERLKEEVAIDNDLLAERQRILDACPCPSHGACVPHVLETLTSQQAKLRAVEVLRDKLTASRDVHVAQWREEGDDEFQRGQIAIETLAIQELTAILTPQEGA